MLGQGNTVHTFRRPREHIRAVIFGRASLPRPLNVTRLLKTGSVSLLDFTSATFVRPVSDCRVWNGACVFRRETILQAAAVITASILQWTSENTARQHHPVPQFARIPVACGCLAKETLSTHFVGQENTFARSFLAWQVFRDLELPCFRLSSMERGVRFQARNHFTSSGGHHCIHPAMDK